VGGAVVSDVPRQLAATELLCLFHKLSGYAPGQGKRHDHETTVDHALIRGLVTAGPVMRRGASSVYHHGYGIFIHIKVNVDPAYQPIGPLRVDVPAGEPRGTGGSAG
jgi:hypothetical protein